MVGETERIREIQDEVRQLSSSLRLRFAGYVLSLVCAIVACVLILLSVTGVIGLEGYRVEQTIGHQLESSTDRLSRDIDDAAVRGIALSQQLGDLVEDHLFREGMSFDDLTGNVEQLEALQAKAFGLVISNMQGVACSGAFFMLNASVMANTLAGDAAIADDMAPADSSASADATASASMSGLYLKYENLHSQNTAGSDVCLFRGTHSVARSNGVGLHSSWQLETSAETFPQWGACFTTQVEDLPQSYFLTETYKLPETWESARFLCVPVLDADGTVVGVCGYEMSDLYFQLAYRTLAGSHDYLVCALLDSIDSPVSGCVAGSQSGYAPATGSEFTIGDFGNLKLLDNGVMRFAGKLAPLTEGKGGHWLAVAVPLDHYEAVVNEGRGRLIIAMAVLLVIALALSWLLSRRYVAPVATRIHHLRMQAEQERLKAEHERQAALDAQGRLSELAEDRRSEVDPYDYQAFCTGISLLTPKERMIFDWHVEGKATNEILQLAQINQNTLKYHNRNIFAKLGVSSRKQLRLFAALLREDGDARLGS